MTIDEFLRAHPKLSTLQDRLLQERGGERIEPPYDPKDVKDYQEIPEHTVLADEGQWMDYTPLKKKMLKNECHLNSAILVLSGEVSGMATGFALGSNNLWTYHSWGIQKQGDETFIVETTGEQFRHYFGVEHSGTEGETWAKSWYFLRTDTTWSDGDEMMHFAKRVSDAAHNLLLDDHHLFVNDVNERSITHKFAEHLQRNFPGWHVDCEYNRDGHEPKRLNLPPRNTMVSDDDADAKTVYPDIIIHERGTKNNLVVIEVKKSTNREKDEWDIQKLREFKTQLGYRIAMFFRFRTDGNTPDFKHRIISEEN